MTLLLVAVAGAAGAAARYVIDAVVTDRSGAVFPLGTLVVNVSGCLAAGLLTGLALDGVVSPDVRTPLAVGFLGSFTTFSTFAYETLLLAQDGVHRSAVLSVAAHVVACIAAAAGGLWVGHLVS